MTKVYTKLAKESQDPRILEELSKYKGWMVRRGVAKNPNTPLDILGFLIVTGKLSIYFCHYRIIYP